MRAPRIAARTQAPERTPQGGNQSTDDLPIKPNSLPTTVRVGCAGWSIPKEHAERFPVEGTHLSRYAGCFRAVEINSSFYRPHRPATYARWAESVPDDFRFSVKMPKTATHERRLANANELLDRFIPEISALGNKLGPLLVQLPPSLAFSAKVAETFFAALRQRFSGDVALEPRHPTWFEAEAEQLVTQFRVSRVAADPAVVEAASKPSGWDGLVYRRLHGSPKMYYSPYSAAYLETLSAALSSAAESTAAWCIFDNTAEGFATANALELLAKIEASFDA